MPEKEAELSALENAETGVSERDATAAGELQAGETPIGQADLGQLQAENDELKRESRFQGLCNWLCGGTVPSGAG
jgi:hypothetical protein